jgi:hypothetical protein
MPAPLPLRPRRDLAHWRYVSCHAAYVRAFSERRRSVYVALRATPLVCYGGFSRLTSVRCATIPVPA